MQVRSLLTLSILSVCGCVSTPSLESIKQVDAQVEAESTAIPYPELDLQTQINSMGIQIVRLQQQIDNLHTRIQQLERINKSSQISLQNNHSVNTNAQTNTHLYTQALQQYRLGNYAAVIHLLRSTEGGGNGDENSRKSMYLLLQSHQHLGNCESVINIGNRYVNRFRNSIEAPETLFSVAQCQQSMQQRDIGRDTLRKLIQIYPKSKAAKRVYQQLKKR